MRQQYKNYFAALTDYSISFNDGRLIFFREGQFILLNSPIILQNGAIIMPDGTIQFSDGSEKKLQEGDTFQNSQANS
jgi:hypothetical protein